MKNLTRLAVVSAVAMALLPFAGVGTAPATTLEINGIKQNKTVLLQISLAPGQSLNVTAGEGPVQTCTGSEFTADTESPFTGATVTAKVTNLSYFNCTHTMKVIANGKIHIAATGETNGHFSWSGSEMTLVSTVFGVSAICKTGAGTNVGTVTGVKSGEATFHMNAKISCGILGTATWAGTYRITSPDGLGIVD
jgi:hypothetical protein